VHKNKTMKPVKVVVRRREGRMWENDGGDKSN
jgi:hypothetical protein